MKSLIVVLILFGLLTPFFSDAAIPLIGGAFGGRIKNVTLCSCSANFLLYIGPPRGGLFIYSPGISTLYLFYQFFRSGPWVLGTSAGTGVCLQPGTPCEPVGYGAIIRKMGTSLW